MYSMLFSRTELLCLMAGTNRFDTQNGMFILSLLRVLFPTSFLTRCVKLIRNSPFPSKPYTQRILTLNLDEIDLHCEEEKTVIGSSYFPTAFSFYPFCNRVEVMAASIYNKTSDNEDIWDDTALIRMYEQSINPAVTKKTKLAQNPSLSTSEASKWNVGDRCLAPYYDEQLWYPAEIKDINEKKVYVLFDGYNNLEWVELADICCIESDQDVEEDSATLSAEASDAFTQKQTAVRADANQRTTDVRSNASVASTSRVVPPAASTILPSFAPPPLPSMANLCPPDEMEALSSMLMSWYMSGYHTGYYQCLSDAKKNKK